MHDQRKALKVKIKSLAAEAGIIRLEERRALDRRIERRDEVRASGKWSRERTKRGKYANPPLHASLREHRVKDVRKEQRSALLAYAFLRGVSYKTVESNARKAVDWERVLGLVRKFGSANPWQPFPCDKATVLGWLAGEPAAVGAKQ